MKLKAKYAANEEGKSKPEWSISRGNEDNLSHSQDMMLLAVSDNVSVFLP